MTEGKTHSLLPFKQIVTLDPALDSTLVIRADFIPSVAGCKQFT